MVREDGDAPANPNKFFFLRPKLDAYLGAKFLSQGRKDLFFKNKKKMRVRWWERKRAAKHCTISLWLEFLMEFACSTCGG